VPPEQSRPVSALDALERMGDLTFRDQSVESVLQVVTDLARDVLPGRPEVSVSLLSDGGANTVVSTGRLAADLDMSQYSRGHGPCLHAAVTGELTEIPDTRADERWPDHSRTAWEQGSGSSLSVPLPVQDGLAAALNVYAREPHAFDDEAREAAQRFAPYAGVAVMNLHDYRNARDMAQNLQLALESRAVIDQAKGILMERHKLTADEAFRAMAAVSMRANRKLRDIAEQLVRTGEFQLDRPGS
jgi:GAF domain-containing protein